MPPKKIQGVPLVIGVTPMRTGTRTSVKQYVDPHPTGGGVDILLLAYMFIE